MDERKEIGFCVYCKEEIYKGDSYVVRNNNKYHHNCFELMKEEFYEEDSEDLENEIEDEE